MTETEKLHFYLQMGDNIKMARQKAELKQEILAEFLNLSRASVVNIEKGRQHPPIHLLFEIAKVLEVEVSSLIPVGPQVVKMDSNWVKLVNENSKGDNNTKKRLLSFVEEIRSSK